MDFFLCEKKIIFLKLNFYEKSWIPFTFGVGKYAILKTKLRILCVFICFSFTFSYYLLKLHLIFFLSSRTKPGTYEYAKTGYDFWVPGFVRLHFLRLFIFTSLFGVKY